MNKVALDTKAQKAACRKQCELKIKEEYDKKKQDIKTAQDSTAAISEQADACVQGKWKSPESCFYKAPSHDVMKADAMKQAEAIMKGEAKTVSMAKIVKDIEAQQIP